jgi:universal stress protein E
MQPIKNTLVYLPEGPGESAVLEQAARIAAVSDAEVEIVDVVEELPLILRTPAFGYPALSDTLEEEMFARLEAAAKKVRSPKVAVSVKALYGKDFIEVTKEAIRGGHDLVLLHGGQEDKTAMRLFRTCPAPVWAIQGDPVGPCKKVLAAVDPLFSVDPDNRLNRRILDAAAAAAQLESAELHVVHAWGEAVEPRQLLKSYAEEVQAAAQAALDALLAPYRELQPSLQVHLVPGRPADAIHKIVREQEMDLLVMGTVVRTGLEGFFIGNTAEELLGDVECSILALKPEGFRSPVSLD